MQLNKGRSLAKEAELLLQQGFTRLELDGEVIKISDLDQYKKKPSEINVLIDRMPVSEDEDFTSRIADSVQTAFFEGKTIQNKKNIGRKVSKRTFLPMFLKRS